MSHEVPGGKLHLDVVFYKIETKQAKWIRTLYMRRSGDKCAGLVYRVPVEKRKVHDSCCKNPIDMPCFLNSSEGYVNF